jgi:putative transposase
MRSGFIAAEKVNCPVTILCHTLRVSTSGFYTWSKRRPSMRAKTTDKLRLAINTAFDESRRTYGSPRIHRELVARGFAASKAGVEREMRAMGFLARRPKRFRVTTDSAHGMPVAENTLGRKFEVSEPNRVWTTDLTYVCTREGWLYLAVIIDLFSRRVLGWATANHMRTSLALTALRMALGRRLPEAGFIHHSDRGSQYASAQYRGALSELGIVCSMSRKGNC